MHSRIRSHLTVLALAAPLALPGVAHAGIAPHNGITSLDPTQAATAGTAAQAIMADPSQLAGASLPEYPYASTSTSHPNASPIGLGSDSPGLTGFPTAGSSYAILTSGDVDDIATQPPNPSDETSFSSYGSQKGNAEARGAALDFTDLRLTVNVPAGASCLALDYKFLSEEYPYYVGKQFNDAFLAEKGGSSWSMRGDGTLTRPSDFATAPGTEPISVNGAGPTAMYPSEVGNTYFNGATGLVTTKTPVAPGPQTIDLSILDANDDLLDSAVFVDNLRFVSESSATCRPPNDVTAVEVTPGPAGPQGQPAVKPVPKATPASTKFTVGSSVRFGATGATATLSVKVPGPGSLSASSSATASGAGAAAVDKKKRRTKSSPLLTPSRVKASKAGVVKLPVKLSAAGIKTLKRKGKVTVPVTVAYTPARGGKATKAVRRITFKKPKKAASRKKK